MKKVLSILIFVLFFFNSTQAANSPFPLKKKDYMDFIKKELEVLFNKIDKNKDSKISKDEFFENPLKEAAERFNNTDINKDGIVQLVEIIMDGDMGELLGGLSAEHQAELLTALGE